MRKLTNQVFPDSVNRDSLLTACGFFGCTPQWIHHHYPNDIARYFIHLLPQHDVIIDSKVHMLMENQLPCIPGWHFDEIDRVDGKIDLENNTFKTHWMCVLDFGTGSLTRFVDKSESFSMIKNYAQLNGIIESTLSERRIYAVENNALYEFDCYDAHEGVKAKGNGWRYFIRATAGSKRKVTNEVRRQTCIYIDTADLKKGW